jgi:hypothetical protein
MKEQTVALVMNGHVLNGKGNMRVSHVNVMTLVYTKISSHVFKHMNTSSYVDFRMLSPRD